MCVLLRCLHVSRDEFVACVYLNILLTQLLCMSIYDGGGIGGGGGAAVMNTNRLQAKGKRIRPKTKHEHCSHLCFIGINSWFMNGIIWRRLQDPVNCVIILVRQTGRETDATQYHHHHPLTVTGVQHTQWTKWAKMTVLQKGWKLEKRIHKRSKTKASGQSWSQLPISRCHTQWCS